MCFLYPPIRLAEKYLTLREPQNGYHIASTFDNSFLFIL